MPEEIAAGVVRTGMNTIWLDVSDPLELLEDRLDECFPAWRDNPSGYKGAQYGSPHLWLLGVRGKICQELGVTEHPLPEAPQEPPRALRSLLLCSVSPELLVSVPLRSQEPEYFYETTPPRETYVRRPDGEWVRPVRCGNCGETVEYDDRRLHALRHAGRSIKDIEWYELRR